MQNLYKWFFLLNKRLYKKLTFILILVLIPVLVFGYSAVAQEESGILTITLAQEGDDPLAKSIMEELKNSTNLIHYIFCDTPEQARKMVNDGKADAAWIFADDLENRIYQFVSNPARRNAFVQVVEQESTIPLKLAREKLSEALFSNCSSAFYLNYLRLNAPELQDISDEELMTYYDNFAANVDLFEFAYLESDGGAEDAENANYLLSPVRGMLAIVIILGGLAAAMFYIHDVRAGTFALVPQNKKALVEFACQMIAVANVAVVALIALAASKLTANLGREIMVLLLYAFCVALFCMVIRRLLGSLTAVGMALPLLMVVMLVICPIFFDLGRMRQFQYLFPPTYYMNAVRSNSYVLLMCAYSAIMAAIYFISGKVFRKR